MADNPASPEPASSLSPESPDRLAPAEYRFLVEAIPQQVWTALPDGTLDHVSPNCLVYFGRTYEEMIGWGWKDVLHPEDLPLCLERWLHSLKTGEPYEVETVTVDQVHGYFAAGQALEVLVDPQNRLRVLARQPVPRGAGGGFGDIAQLIDELWCSRSDPGGRTGHSRHLPLARSHVLGNETRGKAARR